VDDDSWAIRHFTSRGFEMCVAQSFAKNFGLYGERVGALHVVINSEDVRQRVASQLAFYSRAEISTAPAFGSQIVSTILNDVDLKRKWIANLATMANRIKAVRWQLFEELSLLRTPGNWEHVINQVTNRIVSELIQGWNVHLHWAHEYASSDA
jgi:aspartate aminotransferase, cytoplasmic